MFCAWKIMTLNTLRESSERLPSTTRRPIASLVLRNSRRLFESPAATATASDLTFLVTTAACPSARRTRAKGANLAAMRSPLHGSSDRPQDTERSLPAATDRLWTTRRSGGPCSTSPDSLIRHTFGPRASSPSRTSLPVRPHPCPCAGSPRSPWKLPQTGCRAHAAWIRPLSMYSRFPSVMNSILSRAVGRRSTLATGIAATAYRSSTNAPRRQNSLCSARNA